MNYLLQFGVYAIALITLALILIKMANYIVVLLQQVAQQSTAKTFGIVAFIGALSTSIPELVVAITSAIERKNELTLGNVMGSNIANISVTLGLAALISGTVRGSGGFIKQEVFYAFLIGTVPVILLADGALTRIDGILLCLMYIIFLIKELSKKKTKNDIDLQELTAPQVITGWVNNNKFRLSIAFLVGVIVMLGVAQLIVKISIQMATLLGVPMFLIGLLVISIGTTLPELALEIQSIKRREMSMVFGNILGSIVVNATLILGISTIINPITLNQGLRSYLISVLGFVFIFGLFWRFVWTKHRLDRWEGVFLICAYLIFASIQYLLK